MLSLPIMNDNRTGSIIIGICGRSGSGKTTVVEYLVSLGCKRIDADVFAKRAMKKNTQCLNKIKYAFGSSVILPTGELNRKALADIIFSSEEMRTKLNGITLGYIVRAMRRSASYYMRKKAKYIIYDAPLLFEGGLDKECDVIVSVIASDEDCIRRIVKRDGITRESASNRLKSQKTNDFLISNSDIIINNNGSVEDLIEQTNTVYLNNFQRKEN